MKLQRNIFSSVILLMTTVVPTLDECVGEASAKRPLEPFAEAWTHVSPNSVIVYWQTGDDARRVESARRGYVEYGPTADYARKTETFDLPPFCEAVPETISRSAMSRVPRLQSTPKYTLLKMQLDMPRGDRSRSALGTFPKART